MDDALRRRARIRLRYAAVGSSLVCLCFVAFGAFETWDSYHRLPRVYAALRARGLPATARLVRCAPGIGGGRAVGCRLSLTFAGRTRTWNYPEDAPQFEGLAVGAPVPLLVDPRDPSVAYTVHDVDRRTNAGTSPVFWYGVVLIVLGLAGLAFLLWLRRPIPPGR